MESQEGARAAERPTEARGDSPEGRRSDDLADALRALIAQWETRRAAHERRMTYGNAVYPGASLAHDVYDRVINEARAVLEACQ